MTMKEKNYILRIDQLSKVFSVKRSFFSRTPLCAVNDVSFDVIKGETFGLVGESGCGKSTLARCIVHLIKATKGLILFNGIDLTVISKKDFIPFRAQIQLVFQDPSDSLNPRMNVMTTLKEPLLLHTKLNKEERFMRIVSILESLGLNEKHLERFPHQLSGGQQQRVNVARAVICHPSLVILDEPTSALDVSIQSQLLMYLSEIQKKLKMTYILISHDLSVIRKFCDRTGVMYLGSLVEYASSEMLFSKPIHPYTKALISAIPSLNPDKKRQRIILEGEVPSPLNVPSGCPFHTRCFMVKAVCKEEKPLLVEKKNDHWVACHVV